MPMYLWLLGDLPRFLPIKKLLLGAYFKKVKIILFVQGDGSNTHDVYQTTLEDVQSQIQKLKKV